MSRYSSRGRRRPTHDDDSHSNDSTNFFGAHSSARDDRKVQQLCRQVFRILSWALCGDCGDEILQSLAIESVLPAPGASRLLVRVYLTTPPADLKASDVLMRLQRATPMLRREVAAAIVRKRAPELVFQLINPTEALS